MAARREEKEEEKKKKLQKRKPIDVGKPQKSFKKSMKDYPARPAPAEPSASLVLQDDDPDFPRGSNSCDFHLFLVFNWMFWFVLVIRGVGGGRLLSKKEEAEARAEAEEEFDREQRLSKKGGGKGMGKKKGNKKLFGDDEDDLGFLFGEGVTGKLPKYVNRITLKV